mmetsp:Transcript_71485/g.115344  ORF Transcript_71485/g.115344 Transcript_71485/m.115344 type:complete len:232 (-) Transcript_71485:692-1387(-)
MLLVLEVTFGSLGMRVEIESCPICDADTLQPPIGCIDLCIPAVCRIVSHLRWQVLTEAHKFLANSHARQEEVCPDDKVSEGLVVDQAATDSVAHFHSDRCLGCQLCRRMEERQNNVCDASKLWMCLVCWVHEVLDLSLSELPLPCETCSWGDLVAEGASNLCHTEGQAIRILLAAKLVVQEDALCSLRPEVSLKVSSWADRCREHKVELVRVAQVIPGLRGLDGVLFEHLG